MKLFCQIRMFVRARALAMTARMISRPVSSPRAWTIRACEWPPSSPSADLAVDLVEVGAPVDQLADPVGRLAHDHLDDFGIAQALAGRQRVGDVVVEAVLGIEHAGDAPLGVVAVALAHLVLGHDQDAVGSGMPSAQRNPAIPPPMIRRR